MFCIRNKLISSSPIKKSDGVENIENYDLKYRIGLMYNDFHSLLQIQRKRNKLDFFKYFSLKILNKRI